MMSGTYSLYQEKYKEGNIAKKAKQLKKPEYIHDVHYCTSVLIKQQYIKLLHCMKYFHRYCIVLFNQFR